MLYSNALGISVKGPGQQNVLVRFIECREYDGVLREPNIEGRQSFAYVAFSAGFGVTFTRPGNGFWMLIGAT